MDQFVDAIILGLIQGLTEFLPVSSSGHLALAENLLGWENAAENLSFNVAVHLGSLGAVLFFVRREIVMAFTTRPRLILVTAAATLPLVFAAAIGAKDLVAEISTNLVAVGFLLFVTGGMLMLATRLKEGREEAAGLSYRKAILVGVAQLVALLPGVSRSGATLVGGLGAGLKREEAVRFAFLLAVPAIMGAGILMFFDEGAQNSIPMMALVAGGVVSFLSSLVAMKVMVGAVIRRKLNWFALYCFAIGLTAVGCGL